MSKVHCDQCKKDLQIKDLLIKMGGLLCPICRIIMIYPDNPLYTEEWNRRKREDR